MIQAVKLENLTQLKTLTLNFDRWNIRCKLRGDDLHLFDPVRQKWIFCTPEEEVRQWLIHYLVHELGFPLKRIGVERQLKYNERIKRFDLLVFDDLGNPLFIIETKRPSIKISQKAIEQLSVYNQLYHAPYLAVFNGSELLCCQRETASAKYKYLSAIPHYESLVN